VCFIYGLIECACVEWVVACMHGSALPSSDGSLSSPSGSFSFGTPYFYQRGATAVGTPAVGSSFSIVNPLAVWQHSASGDCVSDSSSDQTAVVSSGVRRLSSEGVAESLIGSEVFAVNSIAAAVGVTLSLVLLLTLSVVCMLALLPVI
jgi:hypothetical protein